MKKFIIGFMVLSMVVLGAHKAKAITLDDLANQISNLMQQVSELKSQLSAAVALSRTTTTIATTDTRTATPTTTTTTITPTTTVTTTPVTTTTVAPVTETRTVIPTTVVPKPTTGSTETVTAANCVMGGGFVFYGYCDGGFFDLEGISGKVVKPVINPTNPNPSTAKQTLLSKRGTITSANTPDWLCDILDVLGGFDVCARGLQRQINPNPPTPTTAKQTLLSHKGTITSANTPDWLCDILDVIGGFDVCGRSNSNTKTTAPENSTIPVNAKISFGMRNDNGVKIIQTMLLDLGYLSNSSQVSGNFLGVTKTAITKFQKDRGLSSTGEINQSTLVSLANSDTNPSDNIIDVINCLLLGGDMPECKKLFKSVFPIFGVKNDKFTKIIQQTLLDLGYLNNNTQVTGNYLGVTRDAIKKYQIDNKIKGTGVLDRDTIISLTKGGISLGGNVGVLECIWAAITMNKGTLNKCIHVAN